MECVLSVGCARLFRLYMNELWLDSQRSTSGSTVGGKVEEGRLGTEPGALELSRDVFIQFVNDSGKMIVACFSSLFGEV